MNIARSHTAVAIAERFPVPNAAIPSPGFSTPEVPRAELGRLPRLLVALLLGFASLLSAVQAQTIVHEYYVPLPEAQLRTALVGVEPASGRVGSQMESVISIVIAAPGTVVKFDHWEDGYEVNLNTPTQPSTLIWGDGNDANGIAPGFANDPSNLTAGTVLSLRNTVSLPRNPSTVLFDGRDRVGGTKAIVMSRSNWPLQPGSVLGGAVEITPTLDYGTQYVSPVGVDVSADSMFEYTGLFVMARENATQVTIDVDGSGPTASFVVTLNRGESHLVNNGVKKGATISAGKPVQAHLITGDIGAGYETRWQTLYPVDQWSNSYYSPVGTASNGNEAYVFLYNHQASAITIEAQTRTGTTNLNVPAKDVYRYLLPQQSGTRFSSADPFFGIAVVGARPSSNNVHDWGFTLIPADSLTTEAVCGWGPGSSDLSRNGSPVWVMTQGATRIYVDYNGDRAGTLTDSKGGKYDIHYDMGVLEARTLYDPDRDQTAMRVYTLDGTLLTAAWGQDPSVAGAGNPFLDLGTSVLPFPVPQLKKRWELQVDNGVAGLSVGDVIRYFITVDNRGLLPLGNLNILDPLAAGLSYNVGTTTLNGDPLADSASGTAFPLDAPGYTIPNIPRGGQSVFTYDATVTTSGQIDNTVTSGAYGLTGTATAVVPPPLGATAGVISFTDSFAAPKAFYEVGEGVWIEIDDSDLNQDPLAVETFQVVVTNTGTGDIEIVTLTETGVNTGVFRSTASLPTSTVSGLAEQDDTLYALAGNTLSVEYTDPLFYDSASDTAVMAAPSMVKPLYLTSDAADSDSSGALDRIDPVASADGSTAQTAAISAGGGTVAFDNASSATTGNAGASSLTFSHTTGSGSNRLLLVGISIGNTSVIAPSIANVTYNGVNLTFVQGLSGGTGTARPRTEIWRLVNPPSGSHDVVITTSGGTARGLTAGAVTFTGVDATTPLGTPVTGSANSATSASLNVGTVVGEMVFDSITIGNYNGGTAPAVSFAADQDSRWSQASSYATSGTMYIRGSGSTHVSAGASKAMTRSWTGNQSWSGIAVAIKPAASAATPVIFTQTPSFQAPFSMPAGGVVNVKAYYNLVSGSIGSAVTAELKHGATTFFTDTTASTGSDANGNYLQWSGALGAGVNIPTGEAVSLTVTSNLAAGNSFRIQYDSQTKPSVIQLPASTVIEVESLGLYDAPYPGGNPVTAANNGATIYVRTAVSDPFGHADITSLDLAIDGPGTNGDVTTTLTDSSAVSSSGAEKIYEYAWTTGTVEGGFSIAVTAHEGLEADISDSRVASFNLSFNDSGTPSQTQFTASLNGAATTTYPANSPVFVRVTDIDQNLDPGGVETVQVFVSTADGDVEPLTLTETGPDTGVFVATLPASTAAGVDGDGTLNAPAGSVLAVNYVDPDDSADATSANASIPLGTPSIVTAITRLSPAIVPVGDTVSFLVEVSNNGSVPLPNIALTQTFTAAGLNYLSSTLAPTSSSLTGPLSWANVGPLAVGASLSYTLTFTAVGPAAPAVVDVLANAGGGVQDDALASVTVVSPGLTLTKTLHAAPNDPALIGDAVTFRIVLTNSGNTAIAELPLEDSFSGAIFDFVSASIAPDGTAYGSLFWTDLTGAGDLAPGDSITVDVVLRAKGSANPAVTTASADYTVDVNGLDVDPVSDDASIDIEAATISGTVFDDLDGSGTSTGGDVGLLDAVVTLYADTGGTGNPADGDLIGYTVTNAAGQYEFNFLAPGDYIIVLDGLPPGYTSTAASQIALEITNADPYPDNDFFARFNTIAVGVNDVDVNEASDYAIFKVTGANGDSVKLDLASAGGLGSADISAFTLQVFDGWNWVNYTPGSYVGILGGGVLPVRVNITSEQDDVFETVEAYTLTATPLTGAAATGTGRIYDDGTGGIFLADNITGDPSPSSAPGYPPLDDDRAPSVNDVTVNEVSDYLIFKVTGQAAQKLELDLGLDSDPLTQNADITGFSLEYYDAVGLSWQPYVDGSFVEVPAGGVLLARVDITSEQDHDEEGAEVFTLTASTTSGSSDVGLGTIRDDGTGDVFLPGNTDGDPDDPSTPGYPTLDDDGLHVIKWGGAGALPVNGRMDATIIPNETTTPVIYAGMDRGRFDLHLETDGLQSNDLYTLGGEESWSLGPRTSDATVRFRFYSPGTTTPYSIRNIRFSIEDAEAGEELLNFTYWDAAGNPVELPWNDAAFSYSHTPSFSNSNKTVENGASLIGKPQAGKWVRVDLTGIDVSGISFGFRKRMQSAGTLQLGHLTDEPGKFGFDVAEPDSFTPVFLKADENLQAVMPDYRPQMTWDAASTGPGAVVTQDPPPGTVVGLGDHKVTMTLTATNGQVSKLGFVVFVRASDAPLVIVQTPSASMTSLSSVASYTVRGTVRDAGKVGIDSVSIVHNGTTLSANLGTSSTVNLPWSLDIVPTQGVNTLEISAVDNDGIASATVVRSFNFSERHILDVGVSGPEGTATVKTAAGGYVKRQAVNANTTSYLVQSGSVLTLDAKAKPGSVFSHWSGLPSGANATGTKLIFTMPASDITGLQAHFVATPFVAPAGMGTTFHGLLEPVNPADASLASVGQLSGALSATGTFSGKLLNLGTSASFTAEFLGNGTALFKQSANVKTPTLALTHGRVLELAFDFANDCMTATLTRDGVVSTATLRRAAYSAANKVAAGLCNRKTNASLPANNQGFFTAALPAVAQTPARPESSYPQGNGYATVTLADIGTLNVAGTLADGTTFTCSTVLVADDVAPLFAQLKTPGASTLGGSLGGHLEFVMGTEFDVTSTDLRWIRPAVTRQNGNSAAAKATQLYTDGWPSGIALGFAGGHFDTTDTVDDVLELPPSPAGEGNSELHFHGGKLTADIWIRNFQIIGNTVVKTPATDRSYSLTLNTRTGVFSGTFTPNWTSPVSAKPTYKGVLVSKGFGGPAGYGYFHSNRAGDPNPECGGVSLGAQTETAPD